MAPNPSCICSRRMIFLLWLIFSFALPAVGATEPATNRKSTSWQNAIQIKHFMGPCLDYGGHQVHLWSCNEYGWNQQWQWVRDTSQIQDLRGNCLAFHMHAFRMRCCNTSDKMQQWKLLKGVSSFTLVKILGFHGNHCLDAGGNLHLHPCNASNKYQLWNFNAAGFAGLGSMEGRAPQPAFLSSKEVASAGLGSMEGRMPQPFPSSQEEEKTTASDVLTAGIGGSFVGVMFALALICLTCGLGALVLYCVLKKYLAGPAAVIQKVTEKVDQAFTRDVVEKTPLLVSNIVDLSSSVRQIGSEGLVPIARSAAKIAESASDIVKNDVKQIAGSSAKIAESASEIVQKDVKQIAGSSAKTAAEIGNTVIAIAKQVEGKSPDLAENLTELTHEGKNIAVELRQMSEATKRVVQELEPVAKKAGQDVIAMSVTAAKLKETVDATAHATEAAVSTVANVGTLGLWGKLTGKS